MHAMPTLKRQRGFTLVELVMVIVLMGVIGGMVSVFMKSPIDAYFASARRAALTDVADTTVRRIARDIQRALPNSINPSGDNKCIEYIPTKTGGRYRADRDVGGSGDFLDFTAPDSSFNMLGLNSALSTDQQITPTDVISVYNLGISGSDAYTGINTSAVTSVVNGTGTLANETNIVIASWQFPLASASNRFQVIPASEKVVAYVCSNNNLYRVVGTTLAHICPTTVTATNPSVTGVPILARGVICNFNYSGSDLQRNALVSMVLQLTDSGETVSLQHEVHVSNTP